MTRDQGRLLGPLAPARRRMLLLAVLAALVAALLVAALVVVRVVRARVDPVAQDRPGPVLLVSGYGGSTASLDPIRSTLREAGREVVLVTPLGDGTGDLEAQAADLGRQVRTALRRSGAASVDVVGYSAGGLVARSWVRDFDGASTARRVLSIGSPQHGTSLAELAVGVGGRCPAACRQLRPGSDFLRGLNAHDETPPGPAFVSVWSSADRVVVPPSTARLAGALDFAVQSVCPASRTSHGSLPSDPVVLAALRSTLGPGPPRVPTRAPCR